VSTTGLSPRSTLRIFARNAEVISGGAPIPLATYSIAGDDCGTYVVTSAGIYGNRPRRKDAILVTDVTSTARNLAVDDAYVYWTDAGWIGRVAR
jgi:hypothetical protein